MTDEALSEFLSETNEAFNVLDIAMYRDDGDGLDSGLLDYVCRFVYRVKGNCGFLNLPRLGALADASAEFVRGLSEDEAELTPKLNELVFECLDAVKFILGSLEGDGCEPEGNDKALIAKLAAAAAAAGQGRGRRRRSRKSKTAGAPRSPALDRADNKEPVKPSAVSAKTTQPKGDTEPETAARTPSVESANALSKTAQAATEAESAAAGDEAMPLVAPIGAVKRKPAPKSTTKAASNPKPKSKPAAKSAPDTKTQPEIVPRAKAKAPSKSKISRKPKTQPSAKAARQAGEPAPVADIAAVSDGAEAAIIDPTTVLVMAPEIGDIEAPVPSDARPISAETLTVEAAPLGGGGDMAVAAPSAAVPDEQRRGRKSAAGTRTAKAKASRKPAAGVAKTSAPASGGKTSGRKSAAPKRTVPTSGAAAKGKPPAKAKAAPKGTAPAKKTPASKGNLPAKAKAAPKGKSPVKAKAAPKGKAPAKTMSAPKGNPPAKARTAAVLAAKGSKPVAKVAAAAAKGAKSATKSAAKAVPSAKKPGKAATPVRASKTAAKAGTAKASKPPAAESKTMPKAGAVAKRSTPTAAKKSATKGTKRKSLAPADVASGATPSQAAKRPRSPKKPATEVAAKPVPSGSQRRRGAEASKGPATKPSRARGKPKSAGKPAKPAAGRKTGQAAESQPQKDPSAVVEPVAPGLPTGGPTDAIPTEIGSTLESATKAVVSSDSPAPEAKAGNASAAKPNEPPEDEQGPPRPVRRRPERMLGRAEAIASSSTPPKRVPSRMVIVPEPSEELPQAARESEPTATPEPAAIPDVTETPEADAVQAPDPAASAPSRQPSRIVEPGTSSASAPSENGRDRTNGGAGRSSGKPVSTPQRVASPSPDEEQDPVVLAADVEPAPARRRPASADAKRARSAAMTAQAATAQATTAAMATRAPGPGPEAAPTSPTPGTSALPRALVVFNPSAGWRRRRRFSRTLHHLQGMGFDLTVRETDGPGDAERLAAEAVRDGVYDLVVAAGGDGTINEIISGLAGSQIPLGVMPLGTANVLAAEIGLGADPVDVATVISAGMARPIYLGRVDKSRHFALMAGVGFDARVVQKVGPLSKRLFGKLAFVSRVALELIRGRRQTYVVTVDGTRFTASSVIVANSRFYGGRYVCAPDARLTDPHLHVVLFERSGRWSVLRYILAARAGKLDQRTDVRIVQATSVSIDGPTGDPVQADGEIVGALPARISVSGVSLPLLQPE